MLHILDLLQHLLMIRPSVMCEYWQSRNSVLQLVCKIIPCFYDINSNVRDISRYRYIFFLFMYVCVCMHLWLHMWICVIFFPIKKDTTLCV